MKCPKCGSENPEERALCRQCGEQLVDILGETAEDLRSPTARSEMEIPTARSPMEVPTQRIPPEQLTPSRRAHRPTPTSARTHPFSTTGELPVATVFGNRYEILELIGEGGMGRVYKVHDMELDKVIALKTVRTGGDPAAVQRFKQELLLARKITHKNVIRIHDLGEAEGMKFFTMEFIDGMSLKELVRRRGKIPLDEALPLIRQILSALEEAHRQGVIHRDLKPQNIMTDKEGVPLLMDFGIARSADSTSLTATGAVIGTPDYMSPEQVRGEKAGAQADLFSFGVILYEMLTGRLPYEADTPISKVMMRLTHKPRAPRDLNFDIPKYLESIALKCMELDAALRYKSAEEILADLDRQQVDRSLTLRAQRAVSKRKALWAAAAVLAVVASTFWLWRAREEPPAAAPEDVASVTTLAILPFTNATGSQEYEWMRTGIPEMLITDISQSQYVRPVPGERVYKVLGEFGVIRQTRFDEATLESISGRAHAQSVLYGQFVEAAGNLRLDLTLRSAGTGVSIPIKIESPTAEVFQIVDQITLRVKEQLDLSPEQLRGDTDRPIADVSTGSLAALRAYHDGLDQLRQGSNQAAIPLLQQATADDPTFAVAYAKLAEAHWNMGDLREAEAAIDRAKDLSETAPLPLAERCQIHATAASVKDDLETAAESFSELAELYPDDPDIRLSLASAYEELGRPPEAMQAYQRVIALAPDYGAALLGLGRTQVMTGSSDKAIVSLQEAIDTGQFADDLEAMGMIHSIMGVAYRETADLDKALDHLNLSLDFRRRAGDSRGQATTLFNMASIYENRGEIQKALDAEKKAVQISREMGDRATESVALNNMGITYKLIGDLDRSLDTFRESLIIEMERQDHAELANRLDHIADIYQLKGQYDDAIIYLQQAKTHLAQSEDKQEEAINLHYTGLVRKAQGLYDEALEALMAALPLFQEIEQQIGVAMVHQKLAEIYVSQGRYADAYTSLQQTRDIYIRIQAEHDIAEVKAPFGHLLVKLGLLDEAEEELQEAEHTATGAHAEDLIPHILLARAELALLRGREEEASEGFRQANIQANLSGQKEVAVESRIQLGRLYLLEGQTSEAERLLTRTKDEATKSRLRPLESEAATGLAEAYLIQGDAEAARRACLEAISLADKFSGRPVLYHAYASLGEALESLGRTQEAWDSYAKAAQSLEWIRGSLLPEHVDPFMGRSDIQAFLKKTAAALEKGGRNSEASDLRRWIRTKTPVTED